MDIIPLIIGVAVFFIVLAVIFSVIKKVMKLVFLVFFILSMLSVIGGVFIINDLKDFRENFPTAEKMIILKDETKVLTGLAMTTEDEEPVFLTEENIDVYSDYLEVGNFDAVLGDSYKLMILDLNIFEEMPPGAMELNDEEFEKDFFISVLKSDDPISLLAGEDVETMYADKITVKGAIFGILYVEVMQSPIYFFSQYKKGNILIYPETAIFKAIRFMPLGLVKNTMESVMSKVREKIHI
jgi:hypothetical protein